MRFSTATGAYGAVTESPMHDQIAPGDAKDALDMILPSLAAAGGAAISAALGPPRTSRQIAIDIGVAGLSMLIFGDVLCDVLNVKENRHILAVGGCVGLFGWGAMRAALAVVDAMYLQVEAGKNETAKGILAVLYGAANKLFLNKIAAWARVPEVLVSPPIPAPPPPSPPIVIVQQMPLPSPPAAP